MTDPRSVQFHAPPGWPAAPIGVLPDASWRPAPHWAPAPAGWVFYTSGGQPVAPPPGAWQATPPLELADAYPPSTSVASSVPAGRQVSGWDFLTNDRDSGTPQWAPDAPPPAGPKASPRRRVALIVGAVAVLAVVAVVAVRVISDRQEQQALRPLTQPQVIAALANGNTIDGVELTRATGASLDPAFTSDGVCAEKLAALFPERQGVKSEGGGQEVDPASGNLVGGRLIRIESVVLASTAQAKASYGATQAFNDCLPTKLPATEGPSTDSFRTTRTDSATYIVTTHRNVISLIRTDADPVDEARVIVDDLHELFDDQL